MEYFKSLVNEAEAIVVAEERRIQEMSEDISEGFNCTKEVSTAASEYKAAADYLARLSERMSRFAENI